MKLNYYLRNRQYTYKMDTKELFDRSIKGLQDSFNSLFVKEKELSNSLKSVNDRMNELSVITQEVEKEVEKEVSTVNKLSAFKEYDRQIVELNKKIEFLEKRNEKQDKKLKKKEESEDLQDDEYNSGNEQPPPNMPNASDSDNESNSESNSGSEGSAEELDGDEISVDGVDYWFVNDSDKYIYKFISEEEVDEMPCGTYINLKIKLFKK